MMTRAARVWLGNFLLPLVEDDTRLAKSYKQYKQVTVEVTLMMSFGLVAPHWWPANIRNFSLQSPMSSCNRVICFFTVDLPISGHD